MAANDYYHSFNSSRPPRNDDPLPAPPLPPSGSSAPSAHPSVSPVTSPFDDNAYPPYPSNSKPGQQQHSYSDTHSDTAYHSQGGFYQHQHPSSDPFADQNAIPLQSHSKMDSSPNRYNTDPEAPYPPYGAAPAKRKKKGWLSGRVTWVVYILTTVQVSVFVGELIRNAVLTKTPIAIKPEFNIMIGPSPYVLINMGARYSPCMHNVHDITDVETDEPLVMACPNSTTTDFTCSLSDLCGFGGVPFQKPGTPLSDRSHEPNQWWRFIVPIFLHAGLIHIGFNMLLQWTLGRDMEKEIGSLRFLLVYFSSGIFGFVLGGNYAAPGIASTGASGCLFGILALTLLDLLYNWSTRRSPVKDLLFLLLDVGIAFVLGLLPGLDNFSHIGGFLMGLVLGVCLMHSPQALRERIGVDEPPYTTVDVDTAPLNSGTSPTMKKLMNQPVGFFKGRKPFWWVWWLFRAGALVTVLIGFILLLKNFYEWRNGCSWCHRLSCLPIKDWCDIGSIKLTTATSNAPAPTSPPQRRDFFNVGPVAAMATPVW